MEDCLLWEGPYAEAGKECEVSSPEDEGTAETMYDELTRNPIAHLPALLRGRDRENWE